MDNRITYEELEKMYQECAKSENKPDMVYGNEASLRALFGDETFEAMVARGDIKLLKIDDDVEILSATP